MAAVLRGEYNALELTQAELVKRTGMSLATVQRLLKGEQKFNLDQIEAFAEALDTDIYYLSRRALEWRERRMSEAAPENVAKLTPRRVEDMTLEELDREEFAANRDKEAETDEQFD